MQQKYKKKCIEKTPRKTAVRVEFTRCDATKLQIWNFPTEKVRMTKLVNNDTVEYVNVEVLKMKYSIGVNNSNDD